MSAVVRRREKAKRDYQAREGISLSFVAFVTKACVEALRKHPEFNAHWTEEGHWLRKCRQRRHRGRCRGRAARPGHPRR